MASHRWTIYLLRGQVSRAKDALASGKSHARRVPLTEAAGVKGAFYLESKSRHTVPWASVVQPWVDGDLSQLMSASSSGLLVLKAGKRWFAVTFGYGRNLLNLEMVEPQFGLRVCLNRIHERQIRSLDTKAFEDMVVSRSTQASKNAELPTFGVDVTKDILKSVTGQPRDTKLATRLYGADSLVLSKAMPIDELPDLCKELLNAFKEKGYREHFDWIDHLGMLRNQTKRRALDEELVQRLKSGDTSRTHMAMPEVLNWSDIAHFSIEGARGEKFQELDLDLYLSSVRGSTADLSIEKLKRRRVVVNYARSGQAEGKWSLYSCLVSEHTLSGDLYVLIEGQWYQVNRSLVDRVDTFVNGLPEASVVLPDSPPGRAEEKYNKDVRKSDRDTFVRLDRKTARPGGASSSVEACDLFTVNGELIHVKRKAASSTLSHLFAQGSVAAVALADDREFRARVRQQIRERAGRSDPDPWLAHLPEEGLPGDSQLSVVFAVIADSKKAGTEWLPFFSRLNLMHHAKAIMGKRMQVSVVRVGLDIDRAPELSD